MGRVRLRLPYHGIACPRRRVCAQGFGGPCCARILTTWFATKERGTYWGMWNIAHNLGGFLAPIVAGTAARMYGWKYGARTAPRAPAPKQRKLNIGDRTWAGADADMDG